MNINNNDEYDDILINTFCRPTTKWTVTSASRHTSMSMMVGSMGVIVDEGDSWTAANGDCDEGRWYGDGDGDGDVVDDATGRGRGVGVDDADDGLGDLAADGDSSTSATSAVSVSLSSSFAS